MVGRSVNRALRMARARRARIHCARCLESAPDKSSKGGACALGKLQLEKLDGPASTNGCSPRPHGHP